MEAKWIPVKWHKTNTDDGEIVVFDCEMPKDWEDIFVTVKGCYGTYVIHDLCRITDDNRYYLEDSWYDGWDWYEDVIAWMPAEDPEPYRGE